MTTQTEKWFTDEVVGWRIFSATLRSLCYSSPVLLVTVLGLLVIQSPLEPLTSLITALQNIGSPASWFYLTVIVFCLVCWIHLQAKHTSVRPSVKKSLLNNFVKCANPDVLWSLIQHSGIGVMLTICYLRLSATPYATLTAECSEGGRASYTCLNQDAIFLLLAGAFTGFYTWLDLHFWNGNYTCLPVIPLDKASQIRLKMDPLLMQNFGNTLNMTKYFYLCYALVTSLIGKNVYWLFESTSGLPHFLSPYLAASFLLLCFSIQAIHVILSSCLRVELTQPLALELPNLLEGIKSNNQLLSLLSLQNLAGASLELCGVRTEVFSLSQPGGHPHNWNKLATCCLETVNSISQDITKLISPPPPPPKKPEKKDDPVCYNSPNIRRLAPPPSGALVQDVKLPPPSLAPSQRLGQAAGGVWDGLKRRPALAWLVQEPADVSFREIFARGEAAIFCVEILSHLVRASIQEDRFGVVQKDLPTILTSLINLELSIDKCRGQGVTSLRKKLEDLPDLHLKQELKCSVKSGLYRIVTGFRDHILSVPLAPEYKEKIKSYHNFLEA